MPYDYEKDCENCGAKLRIQERPMNVPGGKEREEAHCPTCNHVVASHMTSGFVNAYLLPNKDNKDT